MSVVYLSKMGERQWLHYFWESAGDEQIDKRELLEKMAAVAVSRYAKPDVREASKVERANLRVRREGCFVCKAQDRTTVWHHVIQVQHGGSADVLNQVELCGACHADVHPWLPPVSQIRSGWTSAGELVKQNIWRLEQWLSA